MVGGVVGHVTQRLGVAGIHRTGGRILGPVLGLARKDKLRIPLGALNIADGIGGVQL